MQRPLATVVIDGLTTSMMLTLLVLSAIYHWWLGRGQEQNAQLE